MFLRRASKDFRMVYLVALRTARMKTKPNLDLYFSFIFVNCSSSSFVKEFRPALLCSSLLLNGIYYIDTS